jgi:hypothetical protein
LEAFRERILTLESQFVEASLEDKIFVASVLRQFYPLWLGEVRDYYASSQPAQEEQQRVIKSLRRIKEAIADN